ncbi:MAG: phytanoyl-CoA dioxygenase family protein [Planctomycetes bacterium]|nr:phytanoyl-CoA dioxygenase family protein [Planctomycetota bacterium]
MNPPIVTAGMDEYEIDYLFDLHGYLILKNAVPREDVAQMNKWVDDHWEYVTNPGQRFGPTAGGQWIGNVETHTYSGEDGCNFQNIAEAGGVFQRLIDYPAWIGHIRRYLNPQNGVTIHENLLNIRGKGGYIGIHGGGHIPYSYLTFRQPNTAEWMVGQINVITALRDIGPGDGPTTLIPGSHKSAMPHPALRDPKGGNTVYRSDKAAGLARGMVEVYAEAGDVVMFTDTVTHGSAERTSEGYRRMVLYRYSPRWIRTRFNYQPSAEFLAGLTREQREIIEPIAPRWNPAAAGR